MKTAARGLQPLEPLYSTTELLLKCVAAGPNAIQTEGRMLPQEGNWSCSLSRQEQHYPALKHFLLIFTKENT